MARYLMSLFPNQASNHQKIDTNLVLPSDTASANAEYKVCEARSINKYTPLGQPGPPTGGTPSSIGHSTGKNGPASTRPAKTGNPPPGSNRRPLRYNRGGGAEKRFWGQRRSHGGIPRPWTPLRCFFLFRKYILLE